MHKDSSSAPPHIRNGRCAVRPYLYGPEGLPALLIDVFDARIAERHDAGPTLLE